MPNTKVTITYSNGATREFVASDDLEALINEGQMFSVTTMHSDISIDEEMSVSKMYAGNPIAAMGHMMLMRRNAEKLLESDEQMNVVIQTLNACIGFMSDEVTSHQSGMSPVEKLAAESCECSVKGEMIKGEVCKYIDHNKKKCHMPADNYCVHRDSVFSDDYDESEDDTVS